VHFNDISPYSQYGEWGALQSIMQTTSPLTSAPPKWQALQGFIAGNACWWAELRRKHRRRAHGAEQPASRAVAPCWSGSLAAAAQRGNAEITRCVQLDRLSGDCGRGVLRQLT
jgi:hypothetical protein